MLPSRSSIGERGAINNTSLTTAADSNVYLTALPLAKEKSLDHDEKEWFCRELTELGVGWYTQKIGFVYKKYIVSFVQAHARIYA